MIDDQIYNGGPAGLSPSEHNQLRSQVLTAIRSDRDETATPPQLADPVPLARRRVRRGAVLATAAAVGVLATATAAAAYVSTRPDPKQAATIEAHSTEVAEVHLPGWRPELNAEIVTCDAGEAGVSFEVYASSGPLAGEVTPAMMIDACAGKADDVGQTSAATPVLCAQSGGYLTQPVVLLAGSSCDAAGLGGFAAGEVEALNQARAVEVAVRAIDDPCPTGPETVTWTTEQIDATGSDLRLVDHSEDDPILTSGTAKNICFGTTIDWVEGTATVDVSSYDE